MINTPPARLSILFARKADLAVIFRTGPVHATRMILWDTKRDTFTDGQWVRHKIYTPRCALSPNGKHLLYFAYKQFDRQGRLLGGFTALSRPPYFKALVFLPEMGTWGGSGLFIDDHHVWFRNLHPNNANWVTLPKGLTMVFHPGSHKDHIGTGLSVRPEYFVTANGERARIAKDDMAALDLLGTKRSWSVRANEPRPEWCVVRDGCIFRRDAHGKDRLLRDLNPMKFEAIAAPYA